MSKSKKEISYLNIYKEKMIAIPWMEPFVKEIPEMFDISSPKSKEFLITCFTNLSSRYHYLSFLNKDDTDKELLKVAKLLSIHPCYPKKSTLFDGLDSAEQHKFWMRLFYLFEIENQKKEDDFFKTHDINNKCKMLTNINAALSYFNYKFPVVNPTNLKGVDLDSEIAEWKRLSIPEVPEEDIPVIDLSPEKEMEDIDISKTIEDIKYLTVKYDIPRSKQDKSCDFEEFFKNFNSAAENVTKFTEDLKVIQSFSQNGILEKLCDHNSDFTLLNINQVKRCQDLMRTIKSIKELHK